MKVLFRCILCNQYTLTNIIFHHSENEVIYYHFNIQKCGYCNSIIQPEYMCNNVLHIPTLKQQGFKIFNNISEFL